MRNSQPPLERGRRIAALLAGAWRSAPPRLTLAPAELTDLIPQLIRGGMGGLAWWKTRGLGAQHVSGLAALDECARSQRLQAFAQEVRLQEIVEELRHYDGIEPMLARGWALHRLYPQAGLRPAGDFELLLDPQRRRAAFATACLAPLTAGVDFHLGLPDLPDRSYAEAFQRSRWVPLRATMIRVLAPEDQLRLLCLHFVQRGGRQPLWLCDIAAVLESLPAGFDWDYFQGGDPHCSAWCRAVIGLAQRLLQARGEPIAAPVRVAWLEPAVLRAWGRWRAVHRHWPNAVEVAFHLKQGPAEAPRRAWQRCQFLLGRGKQSLARYIAPPTGLRQA